MQVSKTSILWVFVLSVLITAGLLYGRNFLKPHLPAQPLQDHSSLLPFPIAEPIGAYGWKEHSFHEKTHFEVRKNDDQPDGKKEFFIHAVSRKSSSALYHSAEVPRGSHPHLVWEWKVTHFPSGKQNKVFASKGDNDFGGRVYAIFGSRTPLTSEVIQYVWDDHFPEGTRTESPYSKKVKILVIQSGPLQSGGWVSEDRDLAKDYEMLFGKKMKQSLTAIGITSDSDNTRTDSEAYFRGFALKLT